MPEVRQIERKYLAEEVYEIHILITGRSERKVRDRRRKEQTERRDQEMQRLEKISFGITKARSRWLPAVQHHLLTGVITPVKFQEK